MPSKFSYLEALAPKDSVPYKLREITIDGRNPVLYVRPATKDNKGYFNALLKAAASDAKKARSNEDAVSDARVEDRALYPEHVITGWDNVVDASTGEAVPYSPEEGAAFLQAIPDWLFDELRIFTGNVRNFVEAGVVDTEQLAKNSPSD